MLIINILLCLEFFGDINISINSMIDALKLESFRLINCTLLILHFVMLCSACFSVHMHYTDCIALSLYGLSYI
jgi:hypothetical protein